MIRIKRISFICILLVVLLSGCTNKDIETIPNEDHIEQIGKPASGGELRVPIIQFDTLNPIINKNKSIYYLSMLIYDGLIRLDENLEPQPALAITWIPSDDGSEWTFELRENVKWHDGKLFSAEDVKFTIDTLRMNIGNINESIYSMYVKDIKNVQIVNSHKVTIQFNTAISNPIEIFTFPIIPKHQFKSSKDFYTKTGMTPIGTGPYKIESYNKYKNIKLVVNDEYWRDKPYITSILAKRIPDREGALTSVEANEVDIAEASNFDWEKYGDDQSLKIYEYVTQDYEFLGFNFNNELMKNKNIRKAIAYSLDRHEMIDEVYLGHATVVDAPIYPKAIFYSEEEKKLGKDVLKAKKILTQSKWENRDTDEWLEDESGNELRLHLLVNEDDPQRVRVSEMIAEQLKQIGIDIVIDKTNWEEYQRRIFSNKFDMVLSGWHLSDTADLRFAFHSSYIGNTNFIGYVNAEMDRLLDESLTTKNTSARKEKYKQIQHLFVEDLPYFSLYYKNNSIIVKNHVKGNITPKPFNIYNNIEDWYMLEEPK